VRYFLIYRNVSATKSPPLPRPRHKIPQMIPFSPGYSLADKPPYYSSAPEINKNINGSSLHAPPNLAVMGRTKSSIATRPVTSPKQQQHVPFLHCKSDSIADPMPIDHHMLPLSLKWNTVGAVRTSKHF